MEKTMRFLSCLLIMAMLVTMMAVPAYADDGGQITLLPPNGEDLTNKTFEIYRIFDATVSDDAIAYQWIQNGDSYYFYDLFYGTQVFNEEGKLIAGVAGPGPSTGKADVVQAVSWIETMHGDPVSGGAAWVADFGHTVHEYIKYKTDTTKGGTADAFDDVKITTANSSSVINNGSSVKFTGLDYGYYLIYETTATDDVVRSAILLTNIDDDVKATLKMVTTSIKKMVKRDEVHYDGLSASIGTPVEFYIEAAIPIFQYYQVVPIFKILDVPDDGFSMPDVPTDASQTSYVVTCGSDSFTLNTDYKMTKETVKVERNGIEVDREAIVFNFINYDYLKTHANQKITIKYNATMNGSSGIGGFDNKDNTDPLDDTDAADINTAILQYTSDPYKQDETNKIYDNAKVYSFQLDVYKQASHSKLPLEGAEFKLRSVITIHTIDCSFSSIY